MVGPILLQIVLIFLNATFASAEIAVISMNDTKLKKLTADGDKRAAKLWSLTEQPARFLATIQVAITLAGLLGSAYAADNFAGPLVDIMLNAGVPIPENILNSISVFLITLILAYFSLVFGELVPKRIAMKKAESMALGMSGMLYFVSKLFAPLVFLLTVSTNAILRLMRMNPEEEEEKVSEEEIRMMLAAGNEQGTIDSRETEMIQNVFEFDDISVEQLCTHRVDIVLLSMEDSIEEWEQVIYTNRHTYYPVCQDNPDNIIGILDARDYFRSPDKSKDYLLEHAMDEPYFIPEGMKASTLFQNMQKSGVYFAVAIDEYGGLTGIVTLHDLMEVLVGDLNESDDEPSVEEIVKLSDNEWAIRGSAELDEVAEELKISLPTEKYDTFSGFICGTIGRIPDNGETFACDYCRLSIQVEEVINHRIERTLVRLKSE